MLNGLYSASSAMDAATRRHEVISQNLAHAQMPGYRRQTVMHSTRESHFEDSMREALQYELHGVTCDKTSTDFTPGTMERTDHPLDMAIQGDGFFVVNGPTGPLYTRNGAFQIDSEGRLVTGDQMAVQGTNGELMLPPNTSISSLRLGQDGTLFADSTEIGKLRIVNFSDPQKLESKGVTLYASPLDMPAHDIAATVFQNMRERSNVSPIQELVDMIAAQRQQEAAQRSMIAISEAVGKNVNAQGR